MRTYSLIVTIAAAAATLLSFAGPVAAQEATYDYPQPIVASKTRAEVKAELATAHPATRFYSTEAGYAFGDSHGTPRRAAATSPVTTAADAQAKVKATAGVGRLRAGQNTANLEPQSFDGTVSAAGGLIGFSVARVK